MGHLGRDIPADRLGVGPALHRQPERTREQNLHPDCFFVSGKILASGEFAHQQIDLCQRSDELHVACHEVIGSGRLNDFGELRSRPFGQICGRVQPRLSADDGGEGHFKLGLSASLLAHFFIPENSGRLAKVGCPTGLPLASVCFFLIPQPVLLFRRMDARGRSGIHRARYPC